MPRASVSGSLLFSFLLALTASMPGSSRANFSIADLADDQLRSRVEILKRGAAELTGPMDAPVVALARTILLEFQRYDATRTENRVFLVRHEGGDTAFEIEVEPDHVERVRGWVVRADGRVERRLALGGFQGDAPVDRSMLPVFSIADLEPGDAWGWTSTTDIPYGVEHRIEPITIDQPVMRTRIHVKSATHLVYWAETLRTEGQDVEVTIREQRGGQPSWLQMDAMNLRARRDAIFSQPQSVREPRLRITRRGRFYPDLGSWILRNDWDTFAALDIGSPTQWMADPDDLELRSLALDVATRGGSDAERVDLLYEWLEENIALRRGPMPGPLFPDADHAHALDVFELVDGLDIREGPPSMSGWRPPAEWESNEVTGDPSLGRDTRESNLRPTNEIIASGEAGPIERAALFASLIRAVGIDVIQGFVRDSRLGPLDMQATGRWQFTDMVVAPVDLDFTVRRWYCPTRSGLAAGALDHGLYGNSVVFIDPAIDDRLEQVWETVWRQEGTAADRVIPRYVERLRRTNLTRILRTPPEPPRPTHRLREVVRFARDRASARGRIEADVLFATEDYWSHRFGTEITDRDPEAGLPAALDLPLDDETSDGRWSLDGRRVFGAGPLDAWEGTDRPPFHVEYPREYRWSVEVPLPAGWSGIEDFSPVEFDHAAMQYRAWIVRGSDTIVLERQLVLHAGTWGDDDLTSIDAVVRSMLDFESGSLELRSDTGSR